MSVIRPLGILYSGDGSTIPPSDHEELVIHYVKSDENQLHDDDLFILLYKGKGDVSESELGSSLLKKNGQFLQLV